MNARSPEDETHLAHYHAVLRTCKDWHISLQTLLLLLRIARQGERGLNTSKLTPAERIALRQNRPWERHGAYLQKRHGPKSRGMDAWRIYTASPNFLASLCPQAHGCPPMGPTQATTLRHRLHSLTSVGLSAAHLSTLIHAAKPEGLLRSDMKDLPWGHSTSMRGTGRTQTLNDLLRLGAILVESGGAQQVRIRTQPAVLGWLLDTTQPWPRLPRQPELTPNQRV